MLGEGVGRGGLLCVGGGFSAWGRGGGILRVSLVAKVQKLSRAQPSINRNCKHE